MKKVSKIIVLGLLITMALSTMFFLNKREDKKIFQEEQQSKENKFLTLMIEKEVGTGNYEESNSSDFPKEEYYFNENLSKCENGSKIKYNEKDKTIDVYTTKADKCYMYFDYDKLGSICRGQNMVECFTSNYKKDETLYYHDKNLIGGAQDDSYRFAGPSVGVKNFVCLDGGETTTGKCANGDSDLYRIIGLFKNDTGQYEMKLIKYDYATITQLGKEGAYNGIYGSNTSFYKGNQDNLANIGGYFWTSRSNQVNEWVNSDLRNINLNDYYLNTYLKVQKHIDTDNLIEYHTWSLNGHGTNVVTPKVMYDNEMDKAGDSSPSNPTQTKEVQNKIGLMYASDYGYAASLSNTSNWSKNLNNYGSAIVKDGNWMYMGLEEWTISRNSSSSNYAFFSGNQGDVTSYYIYISANGVRPSFYLTSRTKIQSGDGSKEHPYRITIEN